MEKKLNNLISLSDFKSGWRANQATKTKRTETGLDILKEGVEEIIPEGLPEEDYSNIISADDKIEQINSLVDGLDDGSIDEVVNYLRDILLEMEQQGFIDSEDTDLLDDKHDGDWVSWIKDVITLDDFPEEGLDGILGMVENEGFEDLDEDVTCPDCDGDGEVDGDECERCEGTGRVFRPDDIPPDNY